MNTPRTPLVPEPLLDVLAHPDRNPDADLGVWRGRDWRSRAACLRVDPEMFFPTAESGPVHDIQVAAAKAVCARCPVVAECLTEALARIPDGVAGGLSEVERRALSRRPERAASVAEQPVSPDRAAQRAGTAQAGGQAA